jgi:mutator protein MutT
VITVVAAIIHANGKILITRRPNHVHLPGLWEFPGGKVEANESLEAALRREIREELGIDIDVLDEYFSTEHHYADKSVRLHFFECTIRAGEPRALDVAELRWVERRDLGAFSFPEADAELIARLLKP